MKGDAAADAVFSSQAKQDEASWSTSPGGGWGKAVGNKESTAGSGVLLPGQLALGRPAPMDGLLGFPQQQLSDDEEEGGAGVLRASTVAGGRSDAGTPVVASVPEDTTFNENLEPEELLFVAPLATASSWRRRAILCGRTGMATLKFVWSTATATAVLVGALLATLIFFWALYPVCTSCVRPRRANSAAVTTAGESGRSTLYINQLQVSRGGAGQGNRTLLALRAGRTESSNIGGVDNGLESFLECKRNSCRKHENTAVCRARMRSLLALFTSIVCTHSSIIYPNLPLVNSTPHVKPSIFIHLPENVGLLSTIVGNRRETRNKSCQVQLTTNAGGCSSGTIRQF